MARANDTPRDDEGSTVGDELPIDLATIEAALAEMDAPAERPRETLAAADLPPPEPLQRTLERLPALAEDVVLVQHNDRAPQHLYPKLDDRGYEYATKVRDDSVLTAIWRA